MTQLAVLDDILDLIADVKEIDRALYTDPKDGLITVYLVCGTEVHSKFLVAPDVLVEMQRILSGNVVVQHQ